jgi:outer membrane lipoprotein carrier protein
LSTIAIDRLESRPAPLLLRLAMAACVLAASSEVVAAERSVDDLVAGVQRRFDATDDLRADVTQNVFLASLDRTVTASGTVVFKRPGKMRWDLKGDEPQIIVADGKTVWFYQPADEQVLKAPLDSVFRSTTPVSFLTGVGKIAEDFTVRIKSQTPDRIELFLDPKRAQEDLGGLELVVEPDSLDIKEARITDPVGNVTDLSFSNRRRNTGVSDDEFDFEVPPGVDVVEAPIGY